MINLAPFTPLPSFLNTSTFGHKSRQGSVWFKPEVTITPDVREALLTKIDATYKVDHNQHSRFPTSAFKRHLIAHLYKIFHKTTVPRPMNEACAWRLKHHRQLTDKSLLTRLDKESSPTALSIYTLHSINTAPRLMGVSLNTLNPEQERVMLSPLIRSLPQGTCLSQANTILEAFEARHQNALQRDEFLKQTLEEG